MEEIDETKYRRPTIEEFIDGFKFEVHSLGYSEESIEDFWGWYSYEMGKNNWRDNDDIIEELKQGNIRVKL